MSLLAERVAWVRQNPSFTYIAPFISFLVLLVVAGQTHPRPAWEFPARVLLLAVICRWCWPQDVSFRPADWSGSTLVGAAAFLLWIAPESLFPGYRHLLPFHNAIVGHIQSSLTPAQISDGWVLFWRSARAILVVPVIEELFWRGWLMRWLISHDFLKVEPGKYQTGPFLAVAVLFAAEHGPYWDVGLITGVIYNAWMVRTKSLADCVWMHAVTNACLSIYVIATGQWQYWQ